MTTYNKIMKNIDVNELFIFKQVCPKCGHKWFPRTNTPKRCPRCQKWLTNRIEDEEAFKEKEAFPKNV